MNNLSGGVMRDIEERDDLTDSDQEMCDYAPDMPLRNHNQIGKADSF